MNDIVVVDNDGLLGMQSLSGDAYLYPGLHRVRVDFFDLESSHGIILSDSGPTTVLRHGPLDSTLVDECVAQAGSCVVQVDNLTIPAAIWLRTGVWFTGVWRGQVDLCANELLTPNPNSCQPKLS